MRQYTFSIILILIGLMLLSTPYIVPAKVTGEMSIEKVNTFSGKVAQGYNLFYTIQTKDTVPNAYSIIYIWVKGHPETNITLHGSIYDYGLDTGGWIETKNLDPGEYTLIVRLVDNLGDFWDEKMYTIYVLDKFTLMSRGEWYLPEWQTYTTSKYLRLMAINRADWQDYYQIVIDGVKGKKRLMDPNLAIPIDIKIPETTDVTIHVGTEFKVVSVVTNQTIFTGIIQKVETGQPPKTQPSTQPKTKKAINWRLFTDIAGIFMILAGIVTLPACYWFGKCMIPR